MKVHHLNCGTMHPGVQLPLVRRWTADALPSMVCHCLLIELRDTLVLVDTGFGLGDISRRRERLSRAFLRAAKPTLSVEETALRQIEALGYQGQDVGHVIVTHLDPDHAGGLSDFPDAQVHVLASEHFGATTQPRPSERSRYRPPQWAHGPRWEFYAATGEPWHGFDAVRDLRGLPPEILMIPLSGHSRGHAGVAVKSDQGWLLHCGDAYFHHGDLHPHAACPAALTLFQRVVAFDYPEVLANQARLRELVRVRGNEVSLFSSHDPLELSRLQRQHA